MALVQVSTLISRQDTRLDITCVTTTELLATAPEDPETYGRFVAGDVTAERLEEELSTLSKPDDDEDAPKKIPITVFHKDEKGIFLRSYQIMGFLKAAGESMRISHSTDTLPGAGKSTKWGAIKGKIDRFVVVQGTEHKDRVYLYRLGEDGVTKEYITKHDSVCGRPLLGNTAKGQRVSLASSQSIEPGAMFTFTVDLLEKAPITEKMVVEMLSIGERVGMLQWRNSGKGRFISFIDSPDITWVPADKVKSVAKPKPPKEEPS